MSQEINTLKLVEAEDLAPILRLAPITITRHASGMRACPALDGFPKPVRQMRGIKLAWVLADVLDWLEAQRTFRPESTSTTPAEPQPPRRPRGRPRKAAPAVAQKGGAA